MVEKCGEATLLDMGEGLLTLAPGDDKLQGKLPPVEDEDLCIDFLLRMKLRRKLLNRLSRRLNRVAHAMDGEDVQPPPPPKYGDLQLELDPNEVKKFEKRWERQEQAGRQLELRRQTALAKFSSSTMQEEEEHLKKYVNDEHEEAKGVKEEGSGHEAEQKGNEEEEQEEEAESQPEGVTSSTSEGATAAMEPEAKEPLAEEATSATDIAADSNVKALTDQECYEAFRDYDDAYEKKILPSTGAVKHPVLEDQDREDDHNSIKYGAGIGASHRSMSSKEKEIEFKRWQTAILGRIPDQPTFEELGLANRVFFLEERRKRLAEEDMTSPSKGKREKAKNDDMDEKSASEEGSGSEDKDDDDEEMTDENDDEDFKAEEGKDDDDSEMEDKEDTKSEEDDKAEAVLSKPVKPISLAAVPSFHEQDHRRLRMIHAHLMASSIHEHARRRIADVTMEYNQAFRTSNELYNQRAKVQSDLNNISFEHRMKVSKLNNDYNLDLAIARARWQKRKAEWEEHRAQRSLPSSYGRPAMGTPITAAAASRADPVSSQVGTTLANIVDGVVMRADPGWNDIEPFEEFKAPPAPAIVDAVVDPQTGETLADK